jgi:SAM-dependent methyltransferase
MSGAAVDPAPVWDVINGVSAYWALRTALDLGVFDAVGECATASELAEACGGDAGAVRLLADVLVSLGFLTSDGTCYRPTPCAQTYLVASSPRSMAALVTHAPGPLDAWPALGTRVREPDRAGVELDAFYRALGPATAPTQRAVAAGVVAELDRRCWWPQRPTVVDLGCGSGAWLAAMRPARAIGVDSAVTPDCGAIEFVAGDYLTADLPVTRADVVVLAHVLRAEPADRAARLVARAVELAGGGTVVVADYPRPDGSTVEECRAARHELLLSLTMLAATPGGRGITVAELRQWAQAAGAEVVAELEPVPRQHAYLIRKGTA